jgi:beta-glucosidase
MRLRYSQHVRSTLRVSLSLATLVLAVSSSTGSAADKWERKAYALLSQMTLDEKIGQMTQIDLAALKDKNDLTRLFVGSMLSGGGSDPADNSPQTWKRTCDELQTYALKTRLRIPLLYGVDAVHGHNNIEGAVIFPHNIGLGATHDPDLVERAAKITAREIAGTGIHWAFAPCVATAQDIRWGRTYESFSDSPELAGEMGAEAVEGLQSKLPGGFRVLACAKHFAGDGGTEGGVDQGNNVYDEPAFRRLFVAPYVPSIKEDVGSIMVSYNSWKGQKLHGHKYLLTDVLKAELGFKGFLISDWAAIDQLPGDYRSDIETSINAGLDMVMIPNGPGKENNYVEFVTLLKQLVADGKVSQARIDDAVRRILRAKFQIGLFDHPFASPALLGEIGSAKHRKVARECVRESLVLLKNENSAVPLSRKVKHLAVVGKAADDLGIQCGGWTIDWQGKTGAVTPGGTTILAAIRKAVPAAQVTYSPDATNLQGAEAIVVVVGEQPYAEMKGDRQDLTLPAEDQALITKAGQAGAPVITILLSGRPLVLGAALEHSRALFAAWLPGTEGDGVADVLFGYYKPSGKLPRHWPRDNNQLTSGKFTEPPQFPAGFGLSY